MLYEQGLYRFICEDGSETLSHADYLANAELRDRVLNPRRMCLYLGRTVITYSAKYLIQNKKKADAFLDLQTAQERNPLQFFAPSGESVDFLNDWSSKILFITAGNRCGKDQRARWQDRRALQQ